MNSAKMILACAAMSVAGATSADDDDSLRGVTGFFVKVDAIDADGAEMGLARDVLKTSVDAALKARGVTVLSLEEVNASTGSGHPGVLSLRIAVEKMPVGFAGFLQLRVFQEVLLRQGTYTVGATWHRDGQFTALSADRGRQLTMELITELLDGLAGC